MLIMANKIVVGARVRPVTDARVDALINSIAEVGLLNPITVVKEMVINSGQSVDGYTLVAGAHRLEAMRRAGQAEIEATVVALDEHERLLAECDENLCGTNLGCAERALLTARRKQTYEFLHPETVHGATLKKGDAPSRQLGDSGTDRFTTDTAETTGRAERSVQRDAERGEKIHPTAMKMISDTKLDTGAFLDEVKVLPTSKQVKFVRARLKRKDPAGKKPKSKSRNPANRATAAIGRSLQTVKLAWRRASVEDRRQIKAWVAEQETPSSDDHDTVNARRQARLPGPEFVRLMARE